MLTENGDGGDGEISTGDKRADAEGSHSFGLAVDTSTIEGSFAGRQAGRQQFWISHSTDRQMHHQ